VRQNMELEEYDLNVRMKQVIDIFKIDVVELELDIGNELRVNTINQFTELKEGARLFESIKTSWLFFYVKMKWFLIFDFLSAQKNVYMFFGTEGNTNFRSSTVFKFADGNDIVPFIAKVDANFTYYLVNKEMSYFLYNSEEQTIGGCGEAEKWLIERQNWFDEER
jgi:hypothetical protein